MGGRKRGRKEGRKGGRERGGGREEEEEGEGVIMKRRQKVAISRYDYIRCRWTQRYMTSAHDSEPQLKYCHHHHP